MYRWLLAFPGIGLAVWLSISYSVLVLLRTRDVRQGVVGLSLKTIACCCKTEVVEVDPDQKLVDESSPAWVFARVAIRAPFSAGRAAVSIVELSMVRRRR